MRSLALALAASLLVACDSGDPTTALERGRALASDPELSSSSFNAFACTTCHATKDGDERILAGYPLVGSAGRPTFWGGYEPSLKSAVDACLVFFMKGDRLDPESPDARALHEYLVSLGDAPVTALPLTVVRDTTMSPPRGDVARGEVVHREACAACHGEPSTGAGAIAEAPVLPDQARQEAAALFPNSPPDAVFVEKIRHGQFFGVGGTMPLYSLEALSDSDLGALLAFYGI